ncbi:MAG: late competence development ComFB family protein [Oscillospiraceae bacterium]|jgi:competence protein ComFB|nr:late competence development ComFB family protein [Oscillospiraceae bacterium]
MATVMHNYMEEIVTRNIDAMIRHIDVCDCDICRLDIAAIALNNLRPIYVVTEKGVLYSKINDMELQVRADVCAAIAAAANLVKSKPRH